MVRILQPFAKSHLEQTLSDEQLRNLLGDKLWTPQASFHSITEVRKWGAEEGLNLVNTKKFFLGYANVMKFVRNGGRNNSVFHELKLKCLRCNDGEMKRENAVHVCTTCGHIYETDGGIIKTVTP
jgi:hypothetical protein